MYKDRTQQQSTILLCPSFQRITANFVPCDRAAGYKLQEQFAVTKSPTISRRAIASGVYDNRAKCTLYNGRERHCHGQPVTPVTGCNTRAAALDSSLVVALATIAIEKIVLAILRRIEECWQPCQEKADEGKQETYA
jgi:hypothetical protein